MLCPKQEAKALFSDVNTTPGSPDPSAPEPCASAGRDAGAEKRGTWQVRPGLKSGQGRRRGENFLIWPRQGDFCPNLQSTEVQGLCAPTRQLQLENTNPGTCFY